MEPQALVPGIRSPHCGIQNPRLSWIPLQMGQGGLPTLAIVVESGYKQSWQRSKTKTRESLTVHNILIF